MHDWKKCSRKTKPGMSPRRCHRLRIFRTRKATSTIRTGCGRFTIMNSWTIHLFEKLTRAVFARHATITDGTGGFTSVCGPRSCRSTRRRLHRVRSKPRFSHVRDYGLPELGFFGKTLLPARHFSRSGRTLCFTCGQGLRRRGEKPEEPEFGILCPEDRRSAGDFSQWKNVSLIEGSIPETLPHWRRRSLICISI